MGFLFVHLLLDFVCLLFCCCGFFGCVVVFFCYFLLVLLFGWVLWVFGVFFFHFWGSSFVVVGVVCFRGWFLLRGDGEGARGGRGIIIKESMGRK